MKKCFFCILQFLIITFVFSQSAVVENTLPTYVSATVQKRTISNAVVAVSNGVLNKPSIVSKNVSWGSNIKGDVGESIVEKLLLPTTVDGRQRWNVISPRYAPQGLDHIAVRWKNRNPTQILVAETKVNTSQLHDTKKYGSQMSDEWICHHLRPLSKVYKNAGNADSIKINPNISRNAVTCDTNIKDPKTGICEKIWSNDNGKTWNYTGSVHDLELAKKQCRQQGLLFEGSADGLISFRRKLYRVDLNNKKVYLVSLNNRGEHIYGTERKLDLNLAEFTKDVRSQYANYLQKIYRMSPIEAKILSKFGNIENIANGNIKYTNVKLLHGFYNMTSTALISAGINALMQIVVNRGVSNFSFKSIGTSAVIGVFSVATSTGIKLLSDFIIKHTSIKLLSTVAKSIANTSGIGFVVGILFAVSGYKLGIYGQLDLIIQLSTVAISTGLIFIGTIIGGLIGSAIGVAVTFFITPIIYHIISESEKKNNLNFIRNYYNDDSGNAIETMVINRKYFTSTNM